jgi:hypothetical protein
MRAGQKDVQGLLGGLSARPRYLRYGLVGAYLC